ncbi:DUF2797 domain-containing protein [Gynuella sp.]|uniref:DUF2797 domain-containing protein n=1 Tax=Gynuella sp. TaxID=2969146 RepID=UPI003D0DF5B5
MNGDLFVSEEMVSRGEFVLDKMETRLAQDNLVHYELVSGDRRVALSDCLGKSVEINFSGRILCCYCGQATNKSFGQGYCYKHFMALAQCDACMMSPEKCHIAQGTCREPEWAENVCLQPHYVYLANASDLKVGITRAGQLPTRWIDQGAVQATPIARVSSRYLSGLVEVTFKQKVADKTNWRAMLKGDNASIDLHARRDELFAELKPQLDELILQHGRQHIQLIHHSEVQEIRYPVQRYPEKISSFNLDKQPLVAGILQGIKGQYLIFDTGVMNVRRHTGYQIELRIQA